MSDPAPVPFRAALRVWLRIGLQSFGGPAGQIAVMHRVLVEEKRWISERRFLHALNYCMLLPGPEAMQLATYVGWLLHRTKGGLAAGALFVLPGALAMMGLCCTYAAYREVGWVAAAFFGIKAAVLAVVVEAVVRIGRRALHGRAHVGLAAVAFIAIFFFDAPFPAIVAAAALAGVLWRKHGVAAVAPHAEPVRSGVVDDLLDRASPAGVRPSVARSLRTLSVGLLAWWTPVALLALAFGRGSVFVQEATFFSRAAVVTFGGAYAVLAYVAQQAVDVYAWLEPGQMLDGLGLAETTPGPLILVVQFVGFQGAFRHPGALDPWLAACLGASITLWVTFVPCFLWIFLGAPYVEALRGNRALDAALSAVTAAVVGVILNLSLWFALHALFATVDERHIGPLRLLVPQWGTLSWTALAISISALLALLRFKVGMLTTLAVSASCGVAAWWLAGR